MPLINQEYFVFMDLNFILVLKNYVGTLANTESIIEKIWTVEITDKCSVCISLLQRYDTHVG